MTPLKGTEQNGSLNRGLKSTASVVVMDTKSSGQVPCERGGKVGQRVQAVALQPSKLKLADYYLGGTCMQEDSP